METTSGKGGPSIPKEVTTSGAGIGAPPISKGRTTSEAGKGTPSVPAVETTSGKTVLHGRLEQVGQFLASETKRIQSIVERVDLVMASGKDIPPIPSDTTTRALKGSDLPVTVGSVIAGGSVSSVSTGKPAKPVTPPIQPPPVGEVAPLEPSIHLSFKAIVASHGQGSTRDSIERMFRSDEYKKYDSEMATLNVFDSTRRSWSMVQNNVMAILDSL